MNTNRPRLQTLVFWAAWCLFLALPLLAKEKSDPVPASLPKILAEGAVSLEQEIAALKAGIDTSQQNLKRTEKELQGVRAQVATLKASLAVQELPLKQAQEALESLKGKAKTIPDQIKEVQQKRDELTGQETARTSGFNALRQEIGRLEAAKHPVWRSPQVRRTYQKFQQLADQYTATAARLRELLEKRQKGLEEERQILEEVQGQLQSYLEEVWKTELLKREAPVPLRQRLEQTWTALAELPERLAQYFRHLVSSGELAVLLRGKAAPLLGLLAFLLILLWGARRWRRLALPPLSRWQGEVEERSLRIVLQVVALLFSHLYALSLVLWLVLAFWTLGLWQTRAAGLFLAAVAVWVALRMGLKLIQAVFAGEDQGGILPLDPDTARFYRRHVKFLLAFILLLGVFGLRAARLLEMDPESRQVLGEVFQVGLLLWACRLLRRRYLDILRQELPGPAWLRKRGFFLFVRALVLLVLGAVLLFSLLGFQNLSAYVAEGAALTGLAIVLFWLVWQGAGTVLSFAIHPDQGWMVQKFPGREELLRRHYASVKRVAVALLVLGAAGVILRLWGIEPIYLARFFTWLTWGPSLGPLHLTLLNLGSAALALYLGRWFSRFLRAFLEVRFYPHTDWDQGIRYTISTTCHYVILLVSIILALNFLGFPLTNLALVAGALGVGIGFGLQNIVNNFVSGLILLFERPIKVGDLLVIDGQWGRVMEIRVRSTTFETMDQAVIIIPNSDLLSNRITNWTRYGKRPARLTLQVGVSYDADVHLVTRLLQDLCEANPRVLREPPVQIFFQAFGDSSLTFTIKVFVKSPDPPERNAATHELNSAIFAAFKEHGIDIPFPQRDLHVKSWPAALSPPPPQPEGGE